MPNSAIPDAWREIAAEQREPVRELSDAELLSDLETLNDALEIATERLETAATVERRTAYQHELQRMHKAAGEFLGEYERRQQKALAQEPTVDGLTARLNQKLRNGSTEEIKAAHEALLAALSKE